MIEEQSSETFTDEIDTVDTIENCAITSTDFDLDKYNLYVDKIRALFVPSLERRIHNCLENFVYRKDAGQLSEFSYLKKCLDVAATWRQPVDAFCTKWTDEKFLKNMLSHAVKYLIKNNLIDCFLNSIILNNRLNKVCRDLDTLGIERDFLRYLTVWNYMNERDYWIDNDEKMYHDAMSVSRKSHDSIDRHSDLDVEIGSRIDNSDKVSRRALKRRATDDSSEDLTNKNDDSSNNFHSNDCPKPQCESWLSIDSSIKEESRSSDGTRRKRSMCLKFPCRATTCPIYRMINFQHLHWEGKMLKLQLCKFSSTTSKDEPLKSMETSKLPLPCKFDDLIEKIVKAEATLPGSSSISRRKKFQAGIINICRRVNETLEKIVKNEIRRCRLDCEIYRDLLSFRLMKKEANGCKVCLLSEGVMMKKIQDKSLNASRGSSIGQLTKIAENENTQESNLTIYESARFYLDESPMNQSETNAKITRDSSDANVFDVSEENFKRTNLKNLEETTRGDTNENFVENETCRCAIYFDSGLVNVDEKNQNNEELDDLKYFQSNSKEIGELSRKETENHSTGNISEDEACDCNKSFDVRPDHVRKNNEGIDPVKKLSQGELLGLSSGDKPEDQICHCDISLDKAPDNFVNDTKTDREKSRDKLVDADRNNREKITRKKTFTNLIGNAFNDQESLSNGSVGDGPEQCENSEENSPKEVTRRESSTHLHRDILEDQKCLCNSSIDNPPDNINHESKDNEDSVKFLDKRVEDVPQSNDKYSKNVTSVSNSHELSKGQNEETSDSPFDCTSSNHREVFEPKKDLITCKSVMIAPNKEEEENQNSEIACACPLDCTCINKENSNDQEADCDSQCSCDSYDDLDAKKSRNCLINDPRIPDVSDKIPRKSQCLIISRDKIECSCIEAEEINRRNNKSNKSKIKSKISQGFDDRKVKSRSLNETPIRDSTSVDCDRELFPASSAQYKCSEMKESKVKSYLEGSPIVSGRFKKSKGQRINISIELCPESESSREKISKSESKNILTLQDDSKKNQSSRRIKVASSRQSRCIYIDRGKSEIQLNSQPRKNAKDECLDGRNAAMHSPSRRPLEFRDYLPSMEEQPCVRNPNVYGKSMKSVVLSNDKFDRRSMNQDKRRNVKNYETKECCKSIGNRRSFDKMIKDKIRSDQEEIREEFPRISGKSERLPNSITDGHHCHGFSSSSVKRMKHLIKTKLRRILLERDKSTNTSKMTLTNRKYRVSVPNGKTERPSFGRQSCRTIWESQHSVSDSTCTSLSLISEDRTFSPDTCDREKITDLFYFSPSTRTKISSSNFRNYPRIYHHFDFTKNEICTKTDERDVTNGMKNLSRLAGGCDFSPKKEIEGEEFRCLKKQRRELTNKLVKKENGKLCEKSINCSFHEITKNIGDSSANDSGLLKNDDCDNQMSRKKYENEPITFSGKLDSEVNSTSRHIHLYEFGQCETSNDELFHCWEEKEPDKKFNPPKICKEELGIKNLKMSEKLYKKNFHDSRTKKPRFIEKENKIPRDIDELKNSSPNLHTMNYRQKGFSYLDYDLRSKLSQYVSLCKNVKHSLLKRLRPGEIYGVNGTSIPFRDRYKFGDS